MTWHLRRGDEILAEITRTGGDFPWMYGRIAPRPAFETLRDTFASRPIRPYAEVEAIHAELTFGDEDGPVPGWALVVDGEQASWRWSVADEED